MSGSISISGGSAFHYDGTFFAQYPQGLPVGTATDMSETGLLQEPRGVWRTPDGHSFAAGYGLVVH